MLDRLSIEVMKELVGKPFELKARGPDKYDCFGLILRGREILGLPKPIDYLYEDRQSIHDLVVHEVATKKWRNVPIPEIGDVVVMGTNREVRHVGLWLPNGILHSTKSLGAVVMPISSLRASGYSNLEAYQWVG